MAVPAYKNWHLIKPSDELFLFCPLWVGDNIIILEGDMDKVVESVHWGRSMPTITIGITSGVAHVPGK